MKKRVLSLALALTLALLAAFIPFAATPAQAAAAAGFTPVTGWDMMNTLKLGVNIGNTLDAHGQPANEPGTETMWGEIPATPALFKAIADKGFNLVRIPVTWEGHMNRDYVIDKARMDRVQQYVDWALDEGLYVILNTHHEDSLYQLMVSGNARAEEKLTAMWSQIAGRFKEYPEQLIFEVLNEPHGDNWTFGRKLIDSLNRLNPAALKVIRESGGNNARRCVMLPTPGASIDMAHEYIHPQDDEYLIVSIHAYTPWEFTAPSHEGGTVSSYTNTQAVDSAFAKMNDIFISKKIPVVIGETGAADKKNPAQRLKWAEHYFAKASELGIPTVWWSVGEQGAAQGNESWALIDRRELRWLSPEILEAMFSAYGLTLDERAAAPGGEQESPPMDPNEPLPDAPNLDTASAWARGLISRAVIAFRLVPETLQDHYRQNITRAEFCALATVVYERHTGKEITALADFTDTDDINVRKMAGLGIVDGAGNGTFDPDGVFDRQMAAVLLVNLMKALGEELTESETTFTDKADIADWALEGVSLAQNTGLIRGSGGQFDPKGPFTREAGILLMLNLWDHMYE